MKYGFGLVGLLVVVGIVLYLQAQSATVVTQAAKPARETVEQIAGVGMKESFVVEVAEDNGRFTGLTVKSIVAGGPMAKMYDLLAGDVVVGIGPFTPRDTDAEMMQAQLLELGARNNDLIVLRNGERVTLTKKPTGISR